MLKLRHICDVNGQQIRRICSEAPEKLTLETGKDAKTRFLCIDTATSGAEWYSSNEPVVKHKTGVTNGTRWASATNRRTTPASFDVRWGNRSDGREFLFHLSDGHCTCCACASQSSRLYVGTRRSYEDGDGRLHCLEAGTLQWTYQPAEVADYPHPSIRRADGSVGTRIQKAYPYRVRTTDEGDWVAFTFLGYLYILDCEGRVRCKLSMRETLTGLYDESFGNEEPPAKQPLVIQAGPIRFEANISLPHVPTYEPPLVQTLDVLRSGSALVVGSRSVLMWLTPDGSVAHSVRLPEALSSGAKFQHTICRSAVSASSTAIVVEVSGVGLRSICDGQLGPRLYLPTNSIWALDALSGRVVIYDQRTGRLTLYGDKFQPMSSATHTVQAMEVFFSPQGGYLVLSGKTSSVFAIE